jgi:hypothetical protein
MEMDQFSDSDHHTGYFCYNCIYSMRPHHCAIVTDEGEDVNSRSSDVVAHMEYVRYGNQMKKRFGNTVSERNSSSTPFIASRN